MDFQRVDATKEGREAYEFHTRLLTHFSGIYREGRENLSLVMFDHWNTEEKKKHFQQGRIPLNFPLVYRLIMNLLGYEKNYPSIIQVEPQGYEDAMTAFVYNQYLRHIQEQCYPIEYKYQRSDVFANGNIAKYGVSEICVDHSKYGDKEIYIRSLPFNQVLFDVNFVDFEMTNCSRIQYFEDVYAEELIREYPEKENLILSLTEQAYEVGDYRELIQLYESEELNKGKKLLRKIVDYKKENKIVYKVILEDSVYQFENKTDAEEYVAAVGTGYIKEELDVCVYKQVQVMDIVLEEKTPNIVPDEFPITIYFPLFFNGEYTNIVEITKDIQKYYDRILSQLDYNIGVAGKTLYEINKNRLDRSQTEEDVTDAIAKGGVLYTTTDSQVVRQNRTQPADPQYFMILDTLMKMAEDNFGGKNFQGIQQYSNQSGIAIEKLQAAATLLASTYVDNLERYSKSIGRKLLKYIPKVYDRKQTFKILGTFANEMVIEKLKEEQRYLPSFTSAVEGFLVVNDPDNPLSDLQPEFKYLFKIVNKDYTTYNKQEQLQKLLVLQQQGLKVPPEVLMDFMELDPVVAHRLMQDYKAEQARIAQLEQQKADALTAQAQAPVLETLRKDKADALDATATAMAEMPQEQMQEQMEQQAPAELAPLNVDDLVNSITGINNQT